MVRDCQRALNKVFIGGCPKDLIYKNKKPFVLDRGHWVKHQSQVFTFGICMCERVGEDSGYGIG